MKEKHFLIGAAVIAVAIIFWPSGTVNPLKPKPAGPDLHKIFRRDRTKPEGREHARIFATICRSAHDILKFDWDQPVEKQRIKTAIQADDLKVTLRQMRMKNWSFGAQYPELQSEIESYMTPIVGDQNGELTPERKTKWLGCLATLAECAEYAAEE
jgi:hypothetical protein